MKLGTELVKSSIGGLLADSNLPSEIKTFSDEILKLTKEQKHHSVFFVNTLLFRIVEKKTAIRFEFRPAYKKYFSEAITRDSQGWLIIEISELMEFEKYKEELFKVLDYEYGRVHGEAFGCCSRYIECSDKKQCAQPDVLMSLGCLYRINLLQNRIFYGINKNI